MGNLITQIRKDLGVKETLGRNRGPRIDQINRALGVELGSPYCAGGISLAYRELETGFKGFPFTARSQGFLEWAKKEKRYFTDPDNLANCKGALGGWTLKKDKARGHVYAIERRLTSPTGSVVAIGTIEYNTNRAGSRDGEGVMRLRRSLPISSEDRTNWFIDLTGIPGGEWF
jgi:hypothetical protein